MTLFLSGDVMTGRGVDQLLPHPADPRLHEAVMTDARGYVALAERVNGPIAYPVDPAWPWGDALAVLDELAPEVRVLNLETSLTRRGEAMPGKAVHYRMNPENIGCLAAARPDVCVLGNNHVLDFGEVGLADTLRTLAAAGIATAGAGPDAAAAAEPAVVPVRGGGRVMVYSFGTGSSGIPQGWAAGPERPGVHRLPDLSTATAGRITDRARDRRRPGDIIAASIHWGSNWGYEVGAEQVRFAHALVDGGVDLVHGHSSHHPRPVERYRGKLILYGCGDLIDDYEGIGGYQEYRDDLRLLYLATVAPATGRLVRLRMVPMQARQLRLQHPGRADRAFLQRVLDEISAPFGVRVELTAGGALEVSGLAGSEGTRR